MIKKYIIDRENSYVNTIPGDRLSEACPKFTLKRTDPAGNVWGPFLTEDAYPLIIDSFPVLFSVTTADSSSPNLPSISLSPKLNEGETIDEAHIFMRVYYRTGTNKLDGIQLDVVITTSEGAVYGQPVPQLYNNPPTDAQYFDIDYSVSLSENTDGTLGGTAVLPLLSAGSYFLCLSFDINNVTGTAYAYFREEFSISGSEVYYDTIMATLPPLELNDFIEGRSRGSNSSNDYICC